MLRPFLILTKGEDKLRPYDTVILSVGFHEVLNVGQALPSSAKMPAVELEFAAIVAHPQPCGRLTVLRYNKTPAVMQGFCM